MRAWHNPFQPPPALYPFTEVVAMMTNSKVLVCSLQMCRADICTPDHDAVRFSVSDPDLLFEELRKAVHAPPFPESTNAICTQKDDFLIDCHIKGFHCDQKIRMTQRNCHLRRLSGSRIPNTANAIPSSL